MNNAKKILPSAILFFFAPCCIAQPQANPLQIVKTIPLQNVSGRYNVSAKEIYVSCGSGYVDLINQVDANHYASNGKMKTNSGARTSLFIPQLHQLIVAAPARMSSIAQLMIYNTN